MSVDNLTGLNAKQKKLLKEIRSEKREDPYAKEAASESKEMPLNKLTHGELEEVEKLKAWESWLIERQSPYWEKFIMKKIKFDSSYTPDNIRNRLTASTGKTNYRDPMNSKVNAKDPLSAATEKFLDGLKTGKGAGGDKNVTHDERSKVINGQSFRIPKSIVNFNEKLVKTPRGGTSPDDTSATPTVTKSAPIWTYWLKDTGAGDGKFGNPHESGTKADAFKEMVDDKQTYIGKPAPKGKRKNGKSE